MSNHYNAVMQYVDDVTDFLNSRGSHGRLRYLRHGADRPDSMTWAEFISDSMYEQSVRQALERVLEHPGIINVQEFNHACKCYILETWMDDVIDYDLQG
jgi:sulfatase maturation enzyme AslB (radical SAM superfamily)